MTWISVLEKIPELEKPVLVKMHKDLGNEIEETYAIAILIKDNLGFYTWEYSNDSFTTLNNKDFIITSVFDFNNNAFGIENNSTFEIVAWKEIESLDQLKLINIRKSITLDDLYSRDGVKITEKQFRVLNNEGYTLIGINAMTYKEIQDVISQTLAMYKRDREIRSGCDYDEDALDIYGWDGN